MYFWKHLLVDHLSSWCLNLWNLPSNINNNQYHQINMVGQAFKHEKLVCHKTRTGLFLECTSCDKSILFYCSLFNDWHVSSKEIHSEVFSKRCGGKFEDGKSLCSEVCLLSEHSPAEWNKCFNTAWKTNSSIQTTNWKLVDTFLSNEIAKQHNSQNKRDPEEAEMSLWGPLQTLIIGFWYSFTHQMIQNV